MLIAPTGMTDAARTEWLKVAGDTLSGIPVDLLAKSCAEARFAVDHPAKVVKFIGGEVREEWDARRAHMARLEAMAAEQGRPVPAVAIEDDSPLDYSTSEIAALNVPLRKMALSKGWLTQAMIDAADAEHRQDQSNAA